MQRRGSGSSSQGDGWDEFQLQRAACLGPLCHQSNLEMSLEKAALVKSLAIDRSIDLIAKRDFSNGPRPRLQERRRSFTCDKRARFASAMSDVSRGSD